MKVSHIIGADLSKETVDLVCHDSQQYVQIENRPGGFRHLLKWMTQQQMDRSAVMIVMEHTGLYSFHLEGFLHARGIAFCKVSALAIKRSLGLVRGKNDQLDARRIARYGSEKMDQLQPAKRPDPSLERLKLLQSTRDALVRQRASLLCSLKEFSAIVKATDLVIRCRQEVIKSLTEQISKLETEIATVIASSAPLKQTATLLQSIVGVGPVLSTVTMIKTQNFSLFENARKMACYCGTAPFEHSSGKSIRGKTRVSHLADKQMKTLLDQGAKSALQHDPEIRDYYNRRIEKGKSKRSTINIIRNKLLFRMFAVINRQSPYVKKAETGRKLNFGNI